MIHNLKQVCPQDHCFAAISYDDAQQTKAEAAYYLGKGAGLLARGGPPVCPECGAVDFHLEDTIARDRLASSADRN